MAIDKRRSDPIRHGQRVIEEGAIEPYVRKKGYTEDDEYVEVTPQSIRLRKMILDHNVRKRYEKNPEDFDA